jgi:aminoglycoside phosphotransferase (APT) family kinase protein
MFPDDADTRLAAWLAAEVDPSISAATSTRLEGGHSSGAWRIDVTAARPVGPLVLKAPEEPSVVYRRDACREARILDDLGRAGASVPPVVAIDPTGDVVGRPCFAMAYVDGRSLADSSAAGFHDDAVLRAASADDQRATWESFHDALAALHGVDPAKVPDASHGANGLVDVVDHWRASLLDRADAALVPRQLALLGWLVANLPAGADDAPAVCMGDARIVNCLFAGTEARAIVDFEVAYAGNPAADIGYSLFMSGLQHAAADPALPGIPTPDETWSRWGRATGRSTEDRDYWTAFGAIVLVITATRAMIQWGLSGETVDTDNPLVAAWQAAVDRAARR